MSAPPIECGATRLARLYDARADAAEGQLDALAALLAAGGAHAHGAVACLRATLARCDDAVIALVVRREPLLAHEEQRLAAVRAAQARQTALWSRALPVLARVPARRGEVELRRTATPLHALDPLGPFREGDFVDVRGRTLTGCAALDLVRRDLGRGHVPTAAQVATTIAGVTLRGLRLTRPQMSRSRLVDLDASGASLDAGAFLEAEIRRCAFIATSLRVADMQAMTAWDSDFSRADFTHARIRGATWTRCRLDGASFDDVRAARATFLACDLRGATFRAPQLGARQAMAGLVFRDCDLRWSDWCGRNAQGARFINCNLFGARGLVRASVEIEGEIGPGDEPGAPPGGGFADEGPAPRRRRRSATLPL